MKIRTALLLAGALISGSALAQNAPAPGRHGAAAMADARAAAHDAQLTKLHDALKLTAAQEPAWTKFKDALAALKPATPPVRVDMSTLTAPERADKMVARAKEGVTRAQAHADAVKAFYAVLTAEQKATFDKTTLHARQAMMEKMMGKMMGKMH